MKITYLAIAACRGVRRLITTNSEQDARCFAFMHDFTSNYQPTVQVLREMTRSEIVSAACAKTGKDIADVVRVRRPSYEMSPALRCGLVHFSDGSTVRIDSPSMVGGRWEMLDLSDEISRARAEWVKGEGSAERAIWLSPKTA